MKDDSGWLVIGLCSYNDTENNWSFFLWQK